jgi:hypothetical protein
VNVNSPLNYDELTEKNYDDDQIYFDKESIINSMDDVGVISFELYQALGRVGYRYKAHGFHFSMAKVASTNLSLEKNFLKFLLYGNGSEDFLGQEVTFDKTGISASLYHEFGFGYSYEINNDLTVGVKLKYLNGAANIWTEKAMMKIYTEDQTNYSITASTDLILHTASGYGEFDSIEFDNINQFLWFQFFNNHGFGGDLGVKYFPVKKLKLSASIIDLGFIRWKTHINTYQSVYPGKEFVFEGLDISDLITDGTFSDSIALADTLDEHFRIETIHDNYTSYLTPKFYAGAAYQLTRNDQVGLLFKSKFPEYKVIPSITLNYRRCFGEVLTLFANYTFQKQFNTLGFGLSVKAGPVNIYAFNDMVDALFTPTSAYGYNIQFGINLIFGNPDEAFRAPYKKEGITENHNLE